MTKQREIKFRALVQIGGEVKPRWFYYTTGEQLPWHIFDSFKVIVADSQYTGLKDKNGIEIYEGDVVRYVNPTTKRKTTHKVYWMDEQAAFYPCCQSYFNKRWEVIGNIYENPELIEKHD